MSLCPRIPVEVTDAIVHELWTMSSSESEKVQDAHDALRTCLFVSLTFRKQALKDLFTQVYLSSKRKGSENSAERLKTLISPPNSRLVGISSFIKTFTLLFEPSSGNRIFEPEAEEVMAGLLAFLADDDLVSVLRGLHGPNYGVKEVSFIVNTRTSFGDVGQIHWSNFSPDFCAAFEALTNSPYLVSVTVKQRQIYSIDASQHGLAPSLFRAIDEQTQ